MVDGNVDAKGTRKVAEAYLEYLYSPDGQALAAKHFYRPVKPELASADDIARFPKIELFGIDKLRRLEEGAGRRTSRTAACSTRSTSRAN